MPPGFRAFPSDSHPPNIPVWLRESADFEQLRHSQIDTRGSAWEYELQRCFLHKAFETPGGTEFYSRKSGNPSVEVSRFHIRLPFDARQRLTV